MKYIVYITILFLFSSCNQEKLERNGKKLGEETPIASDTINLKDTSSAAKAELSLDQTTTSNGLYYQIVKEKPNSVNVKDGDVLRLSYKLFAPNGEVIKSSESAGDNYSIVQGVNFVPNVLDKALLEFKEGNEFKLKVPALHPEMEQFKPGLFNDRDTLVYHIEIKEIVPVVKLDEGVELFIVKKGSGIQLTPGDKIGVDFFGFLENGEAFISSRQVSPEFECIVGRECVVPGLDVAFQNMRINDKAYVKIPAKMAYGKKGHSTIVPPNSNLIYFVTIDYQK